MILPIVQTPQPVLTQKAKKVLKITSEITSLIQDMKDTLNATTDPIGVGLAAPQIGKSLQIFLMRPTEKSVIEVLINPLLEIVPAVEKQSTSNKQKSSVKLEGCLSMLTIWGHVKRPSTIRLRYMDEKGKLHIKKFTGFKAIIIQHEYDHLQGILFTTRVLEQKEKLYQSKKDKAGNDIFEEIEL